MALRINWTHAPAGRMRGTSAQTSDLARRVKLLAGQMERGLSQGTLPFINLPFRQALLADLPQALGRVKAFKHMILLGVGGSALGARALQKAFAPGQDRPGHTGPSLWIADNIDAATIEAWMRNIDPATCCLAVVSKSGGTIETLAQYFILRAWLQNALGPDWKNHVILVTDENHGPLREEAEKEGIFALPVPDHLGGRYSALSAVGLLPAGYLGIDYKALLDGAMNEAAALADAAALAAAPENLAAHRAWRFALWCAELMAHNYSQLIFFSYIPGWNEFGQWFGQLWAESLGKDCKGSMPLPAVGVTDQHSLQQMFLDGPKDKACIFLTADLPKGPEFPDNVPAEWTYLRGAKFGDLLDAEAVGTRMALAKAQMPLVHLHMDQADEDHAGELMSLLMLTTYLTGLLLDINPLDQPAVETGKRLAKAKLGAPGLEGEKADLQAFLATDEPAGSVSSK